MEQAVVDAIRDGDVAAVRRYLHSLPHEDQWQDGGRALAGEVARSGGPGFAQLLYGYGEALPSGPWGEIDPLVWAADHGASDLVKHLLQRHPAPEATLRRALDAAQAWLDVDPEAELRRRAGLADGDAFTVARDHITIDEHEARARRIRLSAANDRWAEVLTEHRAVVTILEQHLDLPVSRDELMARALWSADPESCAWSESRRAIRVRFPAEGTFRWAAARLADEDTVVRRFTAELLHLSTFDAPYAADARAVLQARMAAETDTETLCSVLGAYAGFSELHATLLHELLPFAADDRPQVRRRVALDLFDNAGADDRTGPILETMLRLARDPDSTVRATATAVLVHSTVDTPALRELLAARLDGDDREARIHAATGLALRGDAHALARLRRMSDEDGYDSLAWRQFDHVERVLARRPGT
ncbi:hypothetical protein ABT369_39880 [Dactylosporangium sp. NPDC000244]|uniref:hypothetical protein n=1 Tax=Dactylosporangium sp. NPDC000244 TaxID=3154365 RepID=UPI0033346E87